MPMADMRRPFGVAKELREDDLVGCLFKTAMSRDSTLLNRTTYCVWLPKPAISRDDRRGQAQAAFTQGRQAHIDHLSSPTQLVPARPSRPYGIGAPHGEIHRHHQLAIANDDHQ